MTPLSKKDINRMAVVFKALGNELRLILISNLIKKSLTVGELVECCDAEQSLISHNLKMLYRLGIVERKKKGREVYYFIVKEMKPILKKLLKYAGDSLKVL